MNEYGSNVVLIYIEELEKLRKLAVERDEYLHTAKRIQAEYINFQERAKSERAEIAKFALEGFLKEIIAIRDYLQSALKDLKDEKQAAGIRLVEKEFMRILSKNGVTEIKAKGEKFDPNIHEAIAMEETDAIEQNTVTEELTTGYLLNGRVLRAAAVKVAKPKPKSTPTGQG